VDPVRMGAAAVVGDQRITVASHGQGAGLQAVAAPYDGELTLILRTCRMRCCLGWSGAQPWTSWPPRLLSIPK